MKHDIAASEASMRAAFDAGDPATAATQAIEGYGGELLDFLLARFDGSYDAHVLSIACEDLWTGLPSFRLQYTLRGYCYTLVRNAANRYAVAPANRAERHRRLSDVSHLSEMIDRVRSRTAAHQRTEVKSRMRALRERLPEQDQTLLVLHVDRELSWKPTLAQGGADERGERKSVPA